MRFSRIPVRDLTQRQKDKIDCHRIVVTRFDPFYKSNLGRSLEYPFHRFLCMNLAVLPPEEAEEYTKYFTTNFPNDQLWGKPTGIQHIGRVGFYMAVVYCDHETRLRLEAAEQDPKPEIFYKYLINGQEVEADSRFAIERIADQQRQAIRDAHELRDIQKTIDTIQLLAGPSEESTAPAHHGKRTNTEVAGLVIDQETSFEDLFGDLTDSDNSDYSPDTDDTQYCEVIAVKRFKTDPNEKFL